MSTGNDSPSRVGKFSWVNAFFLAGVPAAALAGVSWQVSTVGLHWQDLVLCALLYCATGVSITAGYHRYFAHRAYACSRPVQLFWLVFGGAAVENSVLWWASDHRDHHRYVDSEQDPYDIMKGVFWAHMGWIFFDEPRPVRAGRFDNVRDLAADPLVRWQDRWYVPLALAVGVVLPVLAGLLYGHPWTALLWGGFVRVVLCHHGTFLINSASHWLGSQPYSANDSSRDNPVLAFLTFGEGYHNFHHAFPGDYRNGIRRWHWDPSKWAIRALAWCGQAWRLRRTPDGAIARARMDMDLKRAYEHLVRHPAEHRARLLERLHEGKRRVEAALARVAALRQRHEGAHAQAAHYGLRDLLARRLRRARKAVALARSRYARARGALFTPSYQEA